MQTLLVDRAISMSEFKKNPAAVLRQAAGRPVAVLNHNRIGFYLLEPQLLEQLLQAAALSASVGPIDPALAPAKTPQQVLEELLSQGKAPAR
jgi:PHD/YefM family antitoxin component YafN of YafNO toxin-antitoxin module